MRCLTLADVLQQKGADVSFICREHSGNLISFIQEKGFKVSILSVANTEKDDSEKQESQLFHAKWLGASQQQDAEQCQTVLEDIKPDWLIVDHYAIDQTWQACLKPTYKKLMVIDDLADRQHQCDLLLDQNYGSTKKKYEALVPESCLILAGTRYALLRPEFNQWRAFSLAYRKDLKLKKLLITLGGVDPDNFTGLILDKLKNSGLPSDSEIKVIMGATAPHLNVIKKMAKTIPYKTEVMSNIVNVAEIMATSDLAIGAAGATTWERCCLGLPTIQLVVAENQKEIAQSLAKQNIVKLLDSIDELPALIRTAHDWMASLGLSSSHLCDGLGADKVAYELLELGKL
jgi:UDP-2,4-diacetamido-2,4,6-trideoxy-beta-L-altropyranose hydrolase